MQHHLNRWRALWNPNRYHGWGRKENFFEGWYFKFVDPTERHAFAVIPGISMGSDGRQHAFIQVLDGKLCRAGYHEFPASAFRPFSRWFEVRVGDNSFSDQGLSLDLPELKGSLQFSNITPWPKMLGAPGIMGWYSFVPFMECYHGVVSLGHELDGRLEVYGTTVDFSGGRGYIEKDWGHSFPSSWIWVQSNHFDGPASVMASVANIPWIGSHFIGYIVGFLLNGRLYRFATYTGAQMRASLGEQEVYLSFKSRRHRLEITAFNAGGTGELVSPISGNMTGKVNESMQSVVEVKLFEGPRLLFEGKGRNAGLEVAGNAGELLTEQWRR
ncbi:MAG: hypothetical protein KDC66_06040 [Phaeodactylibacter sp.]|nr:hypothetical protein [Phaeodactylibacter sp.]MCB9273098.1 hypothetical protein [Lewinellaceae bacterium]